MGKALNKLVNLKLVEITKKCPSESKKGIRDFSLNSIRGVTTPSWRKKGNQKCHHFSEQIALFCCIKFHVANFNTFIK